MTRPTFEPPPEVLAFRAEVERAYDALLRLRMKWAEERARIYFGAELFDWAEMNIPEEMP